MNDTEFIFIKTPPKSLYNKGYKKGSTLRILDEIAQYIDGNRVDSILITPPKNCFDEFVCVSEPLFINLIDKNFIKEHIQMDKEKELPLLINGISGYSTSIYDHDDISIVKEPADQRFSGPNKNDNYFSGDSFNPLGFNPLPQTTRDIINTVPVYHPKVSSGTPTKMSGGPYGTSQEKIPEIEVGQKYICTEKLDEESMLYLDGFRSGEIFEVLPCSRDRVDAHDTVEVSLPKNLNSSLGGAHARGTLILTISSIIKNLQLGNINLHSAQYKNITSNDGFSTCQFGCGCKTKEVALWSSITNVCPKCGR